MKYQHSGLMAGNRHTGRGAPGSVHYLVYVAILLSILLSISGCTTMGNTTGSSAPAKLYKKSGAKYHKVRPGDTLYAISFKAGVDYKTLAAWNNLKKPYTIYPGQVLRLFKPKAAKSSVSKKKKTTEPADPKRAAARPPAAKQSKQATKKTSPPPSTSGQLVWRWPTRGRVISHYSNKDGTRDGIKVTGKPDQQILAAESGKVVYVGSGLVGYGRLIIIKHNDKYLSAYGWNSKLLVNEGETVRRGQQIAKMGVDNSGKPVLHFEIRRHGKPVNPIAYLPR